MCTRLLHLSPDKLVYGERSWQSCPCAWLWAQEGAGRGGQAVQQSRGPSWVSPPSPDGSPHLGKVCWRTPSRGLRVPPPPAPQAPPSPQRVLGLKAPFQGSHSACQYPGALWAGPWVGAWPGLGGPGGRGPAAVGCLPSPPPPAPSHPRPSRWSAEDLLCAGTQVSAWVSPHKGCQAHLAFGTQSVILEPNEQENSHKAHFSGSL